MVSNTLKSKFDIKALELNSLLEITQAINNNLPEDSLYKIYNFTLRASLNIKKLALYVLDEAWACKVNFGTRQNYYELSLPEDMLHMREITPVGIFDNSTPFNEFSTIIPVAHKDRILAFVFVDENRVNSGGEDIETNTNFIQALSNIILVAIENKKLARRQLEQEALKKEIEIAKEVQTFLFPKVLPATKALSVSASYLPHHQVGGDYYDFIVINERLSLFCIADVSGKGVPAAILMSNFQAALRILARKTTDIDEIVRELNYQILQNANGENFITAFVGIYDKEAKTLTYVNAGHNPPMMMQNGKMRMLEKGTTILGSFHPLPFLKGETLKNMDSFTFLGYTDGLVESFNSEEEPFGLERTMKIFQQYKNGMSLESLHSELLQALDTFRGNVPYHDDITLLSCRFSA